MKEEVLGAHFYKTTNKTAMLGHLWDTYFRRVLGGNLPGNESPLMRPIRLIGPIGPIRARHCLGDAVERESYARAALLLERSHALDGGAADRGDSLSGESSR
jgi:hypothetical protein